MSNYFRGQVYRLGTHQTAAYTSAANAITNAIATGTQVVRVVPTTACHVKIGNTPTATTSDPYVKGGEAEYFVVTPGMKVSAIRVATNGTLHVTECSG
jgi:hypothetical protein